MTIPYSYTKYQFELDMKKHTLELTDAQEMEQYYGVDGRPNSTILSTLRFFFIVFRLLSRVCYHH